MKRIITGSVLLFVFFAAVLSAQFVNDGAPNYLLRLQNKILYFNKDNRSGYSAQLKGSASVTSNLAVGGTLGVTGQTNLGNASASGGLEVTGQTNLGNGSMSGSLAITTNLNVNATGTIYSLEATTASIGSILLASGGMTASSAVYDNASVTDHLQVGTLTVSGIASIGSNVFVSGDVFLATTTASSSDYALMPRWEINQAIIDAAEQGSLRYYLTEDTDTGSTSFEVLATQPVAVVATDSAKTLTTGNYEFIDQWVSATGTPNVTMIIEGIYELEAHIYKNNSVDATVAYEWYMINQDYTSPVFMATSSSQVITADAATTTIRVSFTQALATSTISTQRIVIKMWAKKSGTGTDPVIYNSYGGVYQGFFGFLISPRNFARTDGSNIATTSFRTYLDLSNHYRFTVDSSGNASFPGNVTLAGRVLAATGGASLPGLSFQEDPNTGFITGGDQIGFVTGGSQRAYITNGGEFIIVNGFNIRMGNIAGQAQINSGTPSGTSPKYTWTSDNNCGLGRYAVGQPSMVASSVEAFRYTMDGNYSLLKLAVATTTIDTNTEFRVVGDASITGVLDANNLTMNGTQVASTGANTFNGAQTLNDGGSNTNSYKLQLESNNGGTIQYHAVQGIYGANPYLRLSTASTTDGSELAVLDIHGTYIVPVNNAFTALGASANRFTDGYFSGTVEANNLTMNGGQVASQSYVDVTHGQANANLHGCSVIASQTFVTVDHGEDNSSVHGCGNIASTVYADLAVDSHSRVNATHSCSVIASQTYVDNLFASVPGVKYGDAYRLAAATTADPLPLDGATEEIAVASGVQIAFEFDVAAIASGTHSTVYFKVTGGVQNWNGNTFLVASETKSTFASNSTLFGISVRANESDMLELNASGPAYSYWKVQGTKYWTLEDNP